MVDRLKQPAYALHALVAVLDRAAEGILQERLGITLQPLLDTADPAASRHGHPARAGHRARGERAVGQPVGPVAHGRRVPDCHVRGRRGQPATCRADRRRREGRRRGRRRARGRVRPGHESGRGQRPSRSSPSPTPCSPCSFPTQETTHDLVAAARDPRVRRVGRAPARGLAAVPSDEGRPLAPTVRSHVGRAHALRVGHVVLDQGAEARRVQPDPHPLGRHDRHREPRVVRGDTRRHPVAPRQHDRQLARPRGCVHRRGCRAGTPHPQFVVTEPAQAMAALVAVVITTVAVLTVARFLADALPTPASQRRMAS